MKNLFFSSSSLYMLLIVGFNSCNGRSQLVVDTEDGISHKPLIAKSHFSGNEGNMHDVFNAISVASDGKIYYVLSTDVIDQGARMYVYDPLTDVSEFLADLTEVSGEKGKNTIPQGKSHVEFFESNGKLFFATHLGFYQIKDGIERWPDNPPSGYKLYPGGHFLSYDLSSGKFEDLGIGYEGEGILTMAMDKKRGQIYALTWPSGRFIHYDIDNKEFKNFESFSMKGEAGTIGDDYRVLSRAMFVDPRDGSVYFSNADGDILTYKPGLKAVAKMDEVNLRLDYFGKYDPTRPGSMGYNWRQIFWNSKDNVAYGVHGNSGYLFRFDPREKKVELIERLTSEPSKRSGMYDQFTYGYLGFELGPDNETIYYLTGGPVYNNGKRITGSKDILMSARALENLHLVTYNIPNQKYIDHGSIFYEDGSRPTHVNSIAIDSLGNIYTLARFNHNEKVVRDLVIIPSPFLQK